MRLANTNKKYTQIAIYVIITAVIIDILKFVLGYTPLIVVEVMEKLSWVLRVIKPVIFGFIFAYLLEPAVDFFERHLKKLKILKKKQESCRTYGIVVSLVIVIVALAGILSLLVYSVTDQLRLANLDDFVQLCQAYMNTFNEFYSNISTRLKELNIESVELSQYVTEASTYLLNFLEGFGKNVLGSVTNISGFISTSIFSFIIMIYFLGDGKIIKAYLGKVSQALFSDKFNKRARSLLSDADTVFSGYIRGQLADALIMMVLISVTLSIIGVKFAIVIGIFAGIGNLIPYCGPIVAYVGTALVCLLNGQYKQLILAIVFLVIIQTVDGNVIGPKLLSHSINIHPLLVMISLIFGSAIGGLTGMLLAVPVGAFIKVLFVKFIDYRLEQREVEKQS